MHAQFATGMSQRIDGLPRPRSGRRVGLARLTRRRRANTGMCEQPGQTKKPPNPRPKIRLGVDRLSGTLPRMCV